MTDTITLATWEQATEGRRDTNPFDHVEAQLIKHTARVGLYEVVRSYSDHVAESLPGHIDFVDNRFVVEADAETDRNADREAVTAAIREADARHRQLVEEWAN